MSAVTASPATQARLLELQDLDTRLRRARATLNQLRADAELKERQEAVEEAEARLAEVSAAAETADRAAAAASEKASATRSRRDRTRERLESGAAAPRDLAGLQHELDTLDALLGEHEETTLTAMQAADVAERTVATAADALLEAREVVRARADELRVLGQRVTEEGRQLTGRRAALAAALPGPLVALYEEARDANGGIGAARLEGNRSAACGTELAPTEVAALRALPPEAIARCPESGALLIRG